MEGGPGAGGAMKRQTATGEFRRDRLCCARDGPGRRGGALGVSQRWTCESAARVASLSRAALRRVDRELWRWLHCTPVVLAAAAGEWPCCAERERSAPRGGQKRTSPPPPRPPPRRVWPRLACTARSHSFGARLFCRGGASARVSRPPRARRRSSRPPSMTQHTPKKTQSTAPSRWSAASSARTARRSRR